jgi:hypothetical protein
MPVSQQLYIAEIGALRGELNSVIDRMNGNENFSVGTVSAIFAFILTTSVSLISLVLALFSLIIVFIGMRRYFELRKHARNLDNYLKRIELQLTPDGGWTTHYYNTIRELTSGDYSMTRYAFWLSLGTVCLLGTVYVCAGIVETYMPSP